MSLPETDLPRREYLRRLVAVGGAATLAGCLGSDDDSDEADDGDNSDDNEDGDGTAGDGIPDDIDESRIVDGHVLNTAFPVRLVEPSTDEVVTDIHFHPDFSHWHRLPVSIPNGGSRTLRVVVVDTDDEEIPLGPDGAFTVEIAPAPDTQRDLVDIDIEGDLLEIAGRRPGSGEFEFALVSDGQRVWEAPDLAISVE